MILTDENYFTNEADKEYMSVSQFKSFLPQYGGCEARAVAKLNGEWKDGKNEALLVGSYVHSYFEGTLEKFKEENKEIFTQKGELKAQYKQAEEMIKALEKDKSFKQIYTGETEKIFTFDLFNAPWKIKVDKLNLNEGYFIDLKTVRDFQPQWSSEERRRISFVEAWGYILQIAVYKKGLELATGLKDIDGFIVAVTKQSPPDKMVLYFNQDDYELGLKEVKSNIKHILELKNGLQKPVKCGHCDYCRATKQLSKAIHYSDLWEV